MALRSSKIGFEGLIVGIQALDVGFEEPRHAWGGAKTGSEELKGAQDRQWEPKFGFKGPLLRSLGLKIGAKQPKTVFREPQAASEGPEPGCQWL